MEYKLRNKVKRVIDGDSLLVEVDHGFSIFSVQRLRLARINAPELGTPEAAKAKEFVEKFFDTYGPTCYLDTKKSDKYGRYLCELILVHGPTTINLSDELLASGHATPYQGKT